MNEERPSKPDVHKPSLMHKMDRSALWTVIGIILLFSTAVIVTLVVPLYVDSSWRQPTTPYQVQMYEIEDPYVYISSAATYGISLQYVHHLKQDFTLLAFKEDSNIRIMAPTDLEQFVTRYEDSKLKLTSRLLLLRSPSGEAIERAQQLNEQLQKQWEEENPEWKDQKLTRIQYQILELYDPQLFEAFSINPRGGILQNWVDRNFTILDEEAKHPYHQNDGVVYVLNPVEFRISPVQFADQKRWNYDPNGRPIKDLEELKSAELRFHSRQELIAYGEHIYAIEGCWYCHTDQTRTLIQDVVLNGTESYPAPPSSPNEYIYQKITFPGTRRIGPDLSRVAVKRPSLDWHKAHFWAPKTASAGSIMPAFQHFFDDDPRGTSKSTVGIPNYQFEAIFQYLMTKGTRITPPTQAWWLGQDPIKTKEIIEGQRKLNDSTHR
jgi:cytochrome c oxidase cbb3-type subunit 2